GEFGTVNRSEADVAVADPAADAASDPMAGRASLEGTPYEEQPKAIAPVTTYRLGGGSRGDDSIRDDEQMVDVTGWLYENPDVVEQLATDYELPLHGADEIELDDYEDETSGDGWIGDEDLDIPTGEGGTDFDLSRAYARMPSTYRSAAIRASFRSPTAPGTSSASGTVPVPGCARVTVPLPMRSATSPSRAGTRIRRRRRRVLGRRT